MKKILTLILFLFFQSTFASEGGFEDKLADIMTWVVLIVMPIGGIYLFWQAHIYPEHVAKENNHPQLEAIKAMCLLSLFVGGLLWPIALIWAKYNYKTTEVVSLSDETLQTLENKEEKPLQTNPDLETTTEI